MNFNCVLLADDPSPYCQYSTYYNFPILILILVGQIILLWAIGEKIINWIKKKKDKNK